MSGDIRDLASQFAPMASPRPFSPLSGFEPGTGNPMMDAILMLGGNAMANQIGYMPIGLNTHQNFHDRMQNFRFQDMQRYVSEQTAKTDRASMMRMARGFAFAQGQPFDQAQQDAAGAFFDKTILPMMPTMAEFLPSKVIDQMFGRRGSGMVMARHMLEGGRYRMDPVTGRMGMSAASASQVAQETFASLFEDENIASMRGIRAGQAGELYSNLVSRGMIAGSNPNRDIHNIKKSVLDSALKDIGEAPGTDLGSLSPEKLDKLKGTDQVQSALRGFDSNRTKESLQRMAGAIKAMEEIFGAEGIQNAPMATILNGLDALTHGAMARVDPGRIEMMVRSTKNLAQQAGIGLQGALILQQHAALQAQAVGLDPILAAMDAQHGVAFMGALNAVGSNSRPDWGAGTADQLGQLDTSLTVQAGSSQMANQFNALARIAETQGGFKKGTKAYEFMQALKAGDLTGLSKAGKLAGFDELEFARMVEEGTEGRVKANQGMQILADNYGNQEFGLKHETDMAVRGVQGREDIMPAIQQMLQGDLAGFFQQHGGMNAEDSQKAGSQLGQKIVEATLNMGIDKRRNRDTRNAAIVASIKDDPEVKRILAGKSAEEQNKILTGLAEQTWASTQAGINQDFNGLQGYRTVHNLYDAMDPEVLDLEKQGRYKASADAMMQSMVAGVGTDTPLARFTDALMNVKSGDRKAWLDVMAKTAGMISPGGLRKEAQKQLEYMFDVRSKMDETQKEYDAMEDGPEKEALKKNLESQRRVLGDTIERLINFDKERGLFEDGTGGPGEKAEDMKSAAKDATRSADAGQQVVNVQFPDNLGIEGTLTLKDERSAQVTASGRSRGGAPMVS